MKNIIPCQRLHVNHQKKLFDFADTLSFFPNNCYIQSISFCFRTLIKTLSIILNLYYTFITCIGSKTNEQQATNNEQQAKNNEKRAESNEQQAKGHLQRGKSN